MALNEVLDEIRSTMKSEAACADSQPAHRPRARAPKKPMTKAELEAFRARKMKEEEDRYLGKPSKKAKPRKVRGQELSPQQVSQAVELMHANPNPPRTPREPKRPKMLEPLQPLYLLKIPGLPKGDCLAICLAHGADQ